MSITGVVLKPEQRLERRLERAVKDVRNSHPSHAMELKTLRIRRD